MSTKRKGLLTTSGEWKRHLRRWGRRAFWRGERRAARRFASNEASLCQYHSTARGSTPS